MPKKQIYDLLGYLLGYIIIGIPRMYLYAINDFYILIITYLVIDYIFKVILVILMWDKSINLLGK